jgi:hypothetical protein
MKTVQDERWLSEPEFEDKRELFFRSRYLDREIALQDILSMHMDDLKKLWLEVEAQHALQGFHSDVNSQIERIDPSHNWKEAHRRFAFKRFVLVFFSKAVSREINFRVGALKQKREFLVQKEIASLAKEALGGEKFARILSQANITADQKLLSLSST